MNFQRPENALKRAEELIEVGKTEEALKTLHAAINHRKFRSMWTATIEKIAIKLIELCVDLKNLRVARDGLIQYRTMTQAANIHSLETVINLFRTTAEKKVTEAKKSATSLGIEGVEDLEAFDSPTKVILNSLQTEEARKKERSEKVVLQWYRFLWETYKAILDILRSNSRMEELYHETAQIALEFCRANKRLVEFKRLCEMLRNNWQTLFKKGPSGSPPHQTSPNNPDTIQKTLETRIAQLKVATHLELWKEAFFTCEDIHSLMVKSRKPKPGMLASYYEFLSQICWKSDAYLFHAYSCLRTFTLFRMHRKTLTEAEKAELASRVVLATMVVPFDQKIFEVNYSDIAEKNKMATLFNIAIAPTRQSLIADVQVSVMPFVYPVVRKLYEMLEVDTVPLSLCEDAKPLLDELAAMDAKQLPSYVQPLTRMVFFRLLTQLSKVYSNMTLEQFEKTVKPVASIPTAEKWIVGSAVSSAHSGIGAVKIDYIRKAVVFGDTAKADRLSSLRQPLMEIGNAMRNQIQRVTDVQEEEPVVSEEAVKTYQQRLEEEKRIIRERREEIEKRKELREQVEFQKEQEEREKRVALEQKEQEAERVRLEDEKKKRDLDRELQKKKEREMAKNKEMLEDMKRQATHSVSKGASVVKVGGKKLTDLGAEDLEKLDASQIEKAREAQLNTERAQKVRLRKQEAKRVDHLARAFREEEIRRCPGYKKSVEEQDIAFFNEFKQDKEVEAGKKHKERLAIANILRPFNSQMKAFLDDRMRIKREELKAERIERYKQAVVKAKEDKINRAHGNWQDNNYRNLEKQQQMREEGSRDEGRGKGKGDRLYRPPMDDRWR